MARESSIEEITKIWCQSLEQLSAQMSAKAKEIRADDLNTDLSDIVVDPRELLERIQSLELASKSVQEKVHALAEKRMVLETSITAINKENEGYIEALRKLNENH
ncbi:hypothetical protein FisN_15Hu113 [Fistulifera solaris]|uniref:Uncharacterized protein n=1 Tax=Fistulifera solaris TaxID=1519565 RepID=A0A1Z5K9Q1_FISSO|nr:hypothetical protein FisN_15Hu113 [Fistulifera solaris]|eukprot:GAX22990.1 hypothetical protein FisN_15Hu113 [Fistulifera solaris]